MNYIGLIFTKLTPNITTDKDIEKSKYIRNLCNNSSLYEGSTQNCGIYSLFIQVMKALQKSLLSRLDHWNDLTLIQLFPQFKIMRMHELKIWPSIGGRCL